MTEENYPYRGEILYAINAERARQDEKWGEQNHPDICPVLTGREGGATTTRHAEGLEIPTATRAKFICEESFRQKRGTFAAILLEEFCEAIEAAALGDEDALEEELVQTAAVAVSWIEAIRRRKEAR